MWQRSAIALIFILSGLNLYAQKKLKGNYDAENRQFICADPNILVKPFVNGRAAFMIKGSNPFNYKSNKVGFIDTAGKIVIKPLYSNCSDFHDNAALVLDTTGNTALIDRNGKTIVPFARQDIRWCTNGLYLITRYSKQHDISIVDNKSRAIVPFGEYSAWDLYWLPLYGNGYTVMEGNDMWEKKTQFNWDQPQFYRLNFDKYIAVRRGTERTAKWGVINRDGKEVIPPKFDRLGPFVNQLAPFCIDNRCGVIDTAGKLLISPEYDNLEITSNGFIIAIQNKKSGVVSVNNRIIIPFKYDQIKVIGKNGFLVDTGKQKPYTGKTTKSGVIGKNGVVIIPVENQYISSFGTGYLVQKNNDSTAAFDSSGVRKTDYGDGGRPDFPVWDMGDEKGFIVYNKRKRGFVHYDLVDHLVFKEGNKWGLLDSAGEEVARAQYEKYWYLHTYFTNYNRVALFRDKQWEILNEEGKEIASGPYDEIGQEGNNFLKVKKNGKYGLLNINADVIVPAVYDHIDIGQYSSDMMVALGNKWTYFSYRGRQITPLKYDLVKPRQAGFGEVMINNKWGLVNEKGVEIIPCKYDMIYSSGPLILVSENKLYGLIDRTGKIIMPTVCNSITRGWRERRPIYILIRDGKTGMADASGKLFLPFKYDSATSLTSFLKPGGKLLVKNKGLVGVADSTGKIIVPVMYDNITLLNDTSEHFYWIFRGRKRGVAGEDGKVKIPPVYDNVMPFDYKLPQRYKITQNGKEGMANDDGKFIIPCVYTYLNDITDQFMVASKDGYAGVIDWKQHIIVPFIYQSVQICKGGFIVRSKDKNGVRDLTGREIVPIVYDYISGYFQNEFFLTKDGKMGIADDTGKIILLVVYDQLEPCGTENILVKKDKLTGMIDYKGKVIYPCKYTFINCVDGKVVEIY